MFNNPVTQKIALFLKEIGLETVASTIDGETNLPGLKPSFGKILVDESKLTQPGDLLHEAGHMACKDEADRKSTNFNGCKTNPAEELMAIAWSYAAAVRLNLDPKIVFHEEGYHGQSQQLIDSFRRGNFLGVPMLQYYNMTADPRSAKIIGSITYPQMLKWVKR